MEIQCSEDGECYAQKLKVLFGLVDDGEFGPTHPVSEKVVESVLNHIRQGEFADIYGVAFSSPRRPLNSSHGYVPDWLRNFPPHLSCRIGHIHRPHLYGDPLCAGDRILRSCVHSAFRYVTGFLE